MKQRAASAEGRAERARLEHRAPARTAGSSARDGVRAMQMHRNPSTCGAWPSGPRWCSAAGWERRQTTQRGLPFEHSSNPHATFETANDRGMMLRAPAIRPEWTAEQLASATDEASDSRQAD